MNAILKNMPSRKAFADAQRTLESRGFEHVMSIMADDARKDGVTNFGQLFVRRGKVKVEFYLNFKTIGNLPE